MKLELGENIYVRTKDGIIAKVDYIDDDTIFFDKDLYRTYGDSIDFLEKDNLERIIKASYNIIDILEVGDYVNGVEIINIDDEWITMSDKQVPILKSIANGMIKSVITHEQIEQISYRIGGKK